VILEIAGLVALGLISGSLAGTLGIGGGIIMVPVLTLAFGFSQQEAQATSLLVVLPTSILALLALKRHGIDGARTGLPMGLIGALLALAGAVVAIHTSADLLGGIFGAVLLIVALRMILGSGSAPRKLKNEAS